MRMIKYFVHPKFVHRLIIAFNMSAKHDEYMYVSPISLSNQRPDISITANRECCRVRTICTMMSYMYKYTWSAHLQKTFRIHSFLLS